MDQAESFRRAKSEWQSKFPPGHWALGFRKIAAGAVPLLRLTLPNQRSRSGFAVGAALAAVRKPSPFKGEGGWPKARRMRVPS